MGRRTKVSTRVEISALFNRYAKSYTSLRYQQGTITPVQFIPFPKPQEKLGKPWILYHRRAIFDRGTATISR